MVDVFPRRNLPNEAEQWGRTLETAVTGLDTSVEIVGQQVQSLNRNTASSLSVLANQVTAVQEAQAAIEVTQAQIIAAQADIVATTNFLSTQTLYDQKGGVSGGSVGGLGAGAYAYEGFDGTYDCIINVTTAASGKLLIASGGAITSSGGGAGIGPEIFGVSLPTFTDSATAGNGAAVSASRTIVATLSPNTPYAIRTRRWYYGTTAQFVSWQAASLVVTRLA